MSAAEPDAPAGVRPLNVAIVGATGAVGAELISQLERRAFPVRALKLLASPRSAGRALAFRGAALTVEAVSEPAFEGIDIAFFSAGAETSHRYAAAAIARGALVIDNSSAFRMDAPLVVPEVNAAALKQHRGLIANPNCTAVVAVMALAPLHAISPVRRVSAATYQAASGGGAAAMEELRASTATYLAGQSYRHTVLAHPYAFNLFSHDTAIDPQTGYNGEETKVMREIRKILGAPKMAVGVTSVRVPVLRAHSMALSVTFARAVSPDDARKALAAAPGARLVDDWRANHFPMPVEASGGDDVLVGRIRTDFADPTGRSLALFAVGDQLLKGAALNAIQIAEAMLGELG